MNRMDTEWFRGAVLYELYVRAYRDSNADGHGDLAGVTQKLDYIKSLGVDVIWLLPICPSPLRDDGYDVTDYYDIHEDYGTLDDFRTLVREAHARDLLIITDLVLNHTSIDHPWFQESRKSSDNPKSDWYVWSDNPERYSGTRIIFTDSETSNWTFDPVRGEYYWHRFFSHQPDLNFDNPEVQEEMRRVIRFWLEMGIDGFRMDAIPYLFEREGTNNENIHETHQYLKELRSFIDGIRPGAFLLGEVNQWPEDTIPYFGEGNDEMPLLFHFPVMPRLFKAVAEGKRDSVEWILSHTPAIPDTCQWVVFLRNHDELTLEMVTEEERAYMYEAYAPEQRMRINVGIRRRLAPLLGGDIRKIQLMNSMLMTLPGTPILYYGDEIGMGDDIELPDRNGVRTPMQWHQGDSAGFSEAPRLYAPVIDDGPYDFRIRNVAAQEQDPDSLLNWTRQLIKTREQHPALGRGNFCVLGPDNPAILPFLNVYGDDVVLAVHNLSSNTERTFLDLSSWEGRQLVDLFSHQTYGMAFQETHMVLEPYAFLWLGVQ